MAENNEVTQVAAASTGDVTVQNGNAAQQNADGQPAQPRQGFWGIAKGLLIRMAIIYAISSFFRRSSTPETPTGEVSTASKQGYMYTTNQFPKGTFMDLYVYISEDETFDDFDNNEALFWQQKGLQYGDWEAGPDGDGTFVFSGTIKTSEAVQNNGSLYLHAYMVKEQKSPDPSNRGKYSKRNTVYRSLKLNKYKKRKFHQTVNLLTGQTDAHPDLIKKPNSSSFEILSHWHPNLTINLIDDQTSWVQGSIPAPLDDFVDFIPGTANYFPVLYFNSYWNMNNDYQPINDTTEELSLTLTYSPISLFRWQMYAAQSMKNKWSGILGSDMDQEDGDQDTLKTAFLETSPYLLGLTIVISIVHSVFEFLAFKNDIQFWRSRKSLEGLSVRSVFFNVFQSLIVLLYVLDNETNTVVMISVGIGLLIELWKIHKVVNIKIDRENPLFGSIPRIWLEDKSTYTKSQTKAYDVLAFKYLSWILFPLLAGYSVYSLVYLEQKGWYSWVLNMLYGFLLMFGFIMMTPQLFINYKLKSVAHLPWRMLTYKALNTFIDDIFAFVIKMPMLYRIGTLRDDVIFFIFLYQRYIYRVDPTRVNEFGVSKEMLEKKDEDKGTAIEGAQQNGDTIKAIEGADSNVDDMGDNVIETSSPKAAEETELPPPKPADEKKND